MCPLMIADTAVLVWITVIELDAQQEKLEGLNLCISFVHTYYMRTLL